MLVHARDEHELLQRVCELATARGGWRLAWVGAAVPEGKAVRPIAQAGFEAGYLDAANITWDESPLGLGPTGRCVARADRLRRARSRGR